MTSTSEQPLAADVARPIRWLVPVFSLLLVVILLAGLLQLDGPDHDLDRVVVLGIVAAALGVVAGVLLTVWATAARAGGGAGGTPAVATGLAVVGLLVEAAALVLALTVDGDGHPYTFMALVSCVWLLLLAMAGLLAWDAARRAGGGRQV